MFTANATFGGVSVNEMAQAKKFYVEILGFDIKDETMGLNLLLPGGGSLFVYDKPDHQPANYTFLNLVVSDIDTAVDELTNTGVKFEHYDNMPAAQDNKEILRGKAANRGPDIAWFKDPAGNILAILEN